MSTLVIAYGRRKTARAKCIVNEGKGRVLINNVPLEIIRPALVRMKIEEPLLLAQNLRNKVDIKVEVRGGGIMGQAEASRIAIARALVKYFNSEELKKIYLDYDRTMLAGDPRQTEPEKWMRYSARRWRQKSYR
jgi:small subunit ribosomal protein S9